MPTAGGAGGVRIGVAFDDVTLEPTPTWTYLTATDNLVASYSIDRGRAFEFDKTDTGTATVTFIDRDHVLDPTNTTGPYYTKLEPLRQIQIELLNPHTDLYQPRFRGFIEDYDYGIDADTRLGRLTITCVDLFAILTAIEMQPVPMVGHPTLAAFGVDLASQLAQGNIYFQNDRANDRIVGVMGNAGIPVEFYVVFTLNVNVLPSPYAPSENVLQVVQDAADAEFPTVANVYCDRFGRMCVHGRMARFDPVGTSTDAGTAKWDYHHWHAGDSAAVAAHPLDNTAAAYAQLRQLAFNRGLSKVINSALCTWNGIAPGLIAGQYVNDTTSIGTYGWRSWSAENLYVDSGILTGNTGPDECLAFAQWIVDNFAEPRNRITLLGFRTMAADWPGSIKTWDLLTRCDIGDMVDVTENDATGGVFNAEPFFIEGIHEQVVPLNPDMADVTITLDVSPDAYFPPDSPLAGPH
jgi:hypothetical protein